MHCASAGGLKLESIARSPRACFTVVGGAVLREEAAKKGAGERARPRRVPADAGTLQKVHVLRFDIEQLTGKRG